VISNTSAAVSAYAEAVADGIQDRLRLRLFEVIWAQGRNMSSTYDVRRVVAALLWPADPISLHLVSPDLPAPVLRQLDPGGDAELPEDVAQVERDGVRAQEYPVRHLPVAEPPAPPGR
jgi:hypothetical protein